MSSDWSATQYLKFERERTRAARDLLAQIDIVEPKRVVDIGCGPGNSTELLAARWPDAQVSGFDTSPDMIEKASKRLPHLSFTLADAEAWQPDEQVDVLFANAVFQWMPDHPSLMRRLLSFLKPGGVLAVQMPDNRTGPSHRAMDEASVGLPFSARLTNVGRGLLPAPSIYYDVLSPHAADVDIWHTVYHHQLAGADAIVEWLKGTGLRPYLDLLDPYEQATYLQSYRRLIEQRYPVQANGKCLLPFPRLFIVVTR